MISMIMILNQKGDVMISRQYRDDVSRAAADSFRLQVSFGHRGLGGHFRQITMFFGGQ
jgi:hypothetical protein